MKNEKSKMSEFNADCLLKANSFCQRLINHCVYFKGHPKCSIANGFEFEGVHGCTIVRCTLVVDDEYKDVAKSFELEFHLKEGMENLGFDINAKVVDFTVAISDFTYGVSFESIGFYCGWKISDLEGNPDRGLVKGLCKLITSHIEDLEREKIEALESGKK